MIITAVEPRRKNMTALYIDGEYALSVDTMSFMDSGKKIGSEITDEELYELTENSNINRAKEKALNLIEYRARTHKEIEDRLTPLFGQKAARLAVERLEQLGLINDKALAYEYAETLIEKKHFSRSRAAFEMAKKGIDKDTADEILDEMDPDPVEHIKILLDTKFSRYPNDEKNRTKIINSLKTMGYSWYDINEAMGEYFYDD